VIDYSVLYDNAGSTYTVLAANVQNLFYTATNVTPGKTYKFKVQARNLFGMSLDSNKVSILAAEKPAKPAAPTTVISGSNVMIDWVAPNDNGSPIISYSITIK
jgi:hypothetical protein